jgi:co-chaperonin GroES (HSP10)
MKQVNQKSKEETLDLIDFNFVQDHILVKAIKVKSKDGWAKPKQKDDKPEFGLVLSVGEKIETNIKVDDIILFGRYVSESTDINGESFYMLRAEDCKAYHKPTRIKNDKKKV